MYKCFVQLTPPPLSREGGQLFEALSFLLLYSGHFQHFVQGARLDLLCLMPSYRNEIRVIGMHVLVMTTFPLFDCPAMLFNQLVKFGILHNVKELLVN